MSLSPNPHGLYETGDTYSSRRPYFAMPISELPGRRQRRPTSALKAQREWVSRAACAPANRPEGMTPAEWTALFFDAGGSGRGASARALRVCAGCPVRVECGEYGAGEPDGVWGGVRKVRVQRRRKAA